MNPDPIRIRTARSPNPEQLVQFAESQQIHYMSSDVELSQVILRSRTNTWIEKEYRKLHPTVVTFPRRADLSKSFVEIIFATRQVFDVSHRYTFKETPRDKKVLENIKNVDPSIRALLDNAKFVTVPNPAGNMMLPREWPSRSNLFPDDPPYSVSYWSTVKNR